MLLHGKMRSELVGKHTSPDRARDTGADRCAHLCDCEQHSRSHGEVQMVDGGLDAELRRRCGETTSNAADDLTSDDLPERVGDFAEAHHHHAADHVNEHTEHAPALVAARVLGRQAAHDAGQDSSKEIALLNVLGVSGAEVPRDLEESGPSLLSQHTSLKQ